MPSKSFALKKNHPVVEQFRAGLRAWEHPCGEPDRADVGTSGPAKKAKTIRARGAVRPERTSSGEIDRFRMMDASDQLVVEKFRDGLAHWERRFEVGSEKD